MKTVVKTSVTVIGKLGSTKEDTCFKDTLNYLEENHISLVGTVHDFTEPTTGKNDRVFPIRKMR